MKHPIEDPDPAGFDYDTGWGFVNGEAALNDVPVASSSTPATRASDREERNTEPAGFGMTNWLALAKQ